MFTTYSLSEACNAPDVDSVGNYVISYAELTSI